jgi:uncharacterized damage-inducible protein DinB
MPDPRYPIGPHTLEHTLSPDRRGTLIDQIAALPAAMAAAVAGMSDGELDTPYRPGGWSVRQLVHHVADSHMNAYIRCRLALTEVNPVIKAYDQDRWAALPDSRLPVEPSIAILRGVHERWLTLLRSLAPEDFARPFQHPEAGSMTLDTVVGLYAWHGRHHVAHVHLVRPAA